MLSRYRTTRRQVSLARVLSKYGIASRAQAADIIRRGKVTVNACVVRSIHVWVDPGVDEIAMDGKTLRARKPIYLAMHKPAGVVTTRSDELNRQTVYDLLPGSKPWLFPVGRLDKETSGLLLFTNDTRLGQFMTDPLSELPKVYRVRIDRPLRSEDRLTLQEPMVLPGGTRLKPSRVVPLGNDHRELEVTVVEGKNRQIRRMFDALGYAVVSLHRTGIGPIRLGDLRAGATRPLRAQERSALAVHLSARG